jgi:hypothetical protein
MDIRTTLYTTRGAVTAVARALSISDAAVSQWKKRGIPDDRREAVKVALQAYLAESAAKARAA